MTMCSPVCVVTSSALVFLIDDLRFNSKQIYPCEDSCNVTCHTVFTQMAQSINVAHPLSSIQSDDAQGGKGHFGGSQHWGLTSEAALINDKDGGRSQHSYEIRDASQLRVLGHGQWREVDAIAQRAICMAKQVNWCIALDVGSDRLSRCGALLAADALDTSVERPIRRGWCVATSLALLCTEQWRIK